MIKNHQFQLKWWYLFPSIEKKKKKKQNEMKFRSICFWIFGLEKIENEKRIVRTTISCFCDIKKWKKSCKYCERTFISFNFETIGWFITTFNSSWFVFVSLYACGFSQSKNSKWNKTKKPKNEKTKKSKKKKQFLHQIVKWMFMPKEKN